MHPARPRASAPRDAVLTALLLMLLTAGCSDDGLTPQPVYPDAATFSVSNGSHGGTEGFHFLPPMVKAPAYGGTFDPALQPVVEICETAACDALHESYSTTEGTGSEVVRPVEEDEHYIVNWHTHETEAVAGQTYRVRVMVSGVVLGHADVAVVSTGREAAQVRADGLIALVANQTLPVKFRIETGIVGAVVVSPPEATIDVGETQEFSATLYDLHGEELAEPAVAWSSDDTGVATVDADGVAAGVKDGAATITASAGPASGTALLTVSGSAVAANWQPVGTGVNGGVHSLTVYDGEW